VEQHAHKLLHEVRIAFAAFGDEGDRFFRNIAIAFGSRRAPPPAGGALCDRSRQQSPYKLACALPREWGQIESCVPQLALAPQRTPVE
jgi:hypothetical protein